MNGARGGSGLQVAARPFTMCSCAQDIKRCVSELIIIREIGKFNIGSILYYPGWTRFVPGRLRWPIDLIARGPEDADRIGVLGNRMWTGASSGRVHEHPKVCAVDR